MSVTEEASESRVKAGLQCLHSGVVEADQIDQLGHMNVRFYGVCALRGISALAGRLGLLDAEDGDDAPRIGFTDMYTRHYWEQLSGAPLEVWGGVLEVRGTELRIYSELVNPDREELAAIFIHVMQLQARDTHAPLPFVSEVMKLAQDAVVAWPEHGHSRTIDVDSGPPLLSMADAQARGLESRGARTIREDECDSDGRYKTNSFLELVWGGKKIDGSRSGNWLRDLGGGRKMGWAMMESRGSLAALPRAGTRIQSFSAIVEIGRKIRHERYWVYDIDRAALLCTASTVNVAFDIAGRKAIEVPATERTRLERRYHPDLL